MKVTRIVSISTISTAAVSMGLICASDPCLAGGPTCVTGSTVKVCLIWGQGQAPVEGTDFSVTFTDPANPNVSLLKGDNAWGVYADLVASPGTPANIGAITLDPAQPADNFGVAIANGASPGAAAVGDIDLSPGGGFTGFTNLGATHVTGDLGDLTLVKDSGGGGGSIVGDVAINGNVTGVVTVPGHLSASLKVGGNLTGTMIIKTFTVDNKSLTIEGDLSGTLLINGDLTATDPGLAVGSSIVIEGELTSRGT